MLLLFLVLRELMQVDQVSPKSVATSPGISGSSTNTSKPRDPEKPIPAANGVGGPWKVLEYKLGYLIEDIADTAGTLVKNEDGDFLDIVEGKIITAGVLTSKVQNFLSAVFTQVVAAVRQSLANLAESLELVSLLGGATGVSLCHIYCYSNSSADNSKSTLCC